MDHYMCSCVDVRASITVCRAIINFIKLLNFSSFKRLNGTKSIVVIIKEVEKAVTLNGVQRKGIVT